MGKKNFPKGSILLLFMTSPQITGMLRVGCPASPGSKTYQFIKLGNSWLLIEIKSIFIWDEDPYFYLEL